MSKVNRIVKALTKMSSQLKNEIVKQENVIDNSVERLSDIQRTELTVQRNAKYEIDTANEWLKVLPSVK
ncbi:MAG: hypothetical protein JKY81_02390 [Colwellia sp.]|nr:hypothetical protein [Colwellia sp.]